MYIPNLCRFKEAVKKKVLDFREVLFFVFSICDKRYGVKYNMTLGVNRSDLFWILFFERKKKGSETVHHNITFIIIIST
jgi:hypothetical protein